MNPNKRNERVRSKETICKFDVKPLFNILENHTQISNYKMYNVIKRYYTLTYLIKKNA